ncbi:hypothetical protein FDT66_03775 [Polaribacter aestuariivivens]|uniref:Lipoprotein n=1 Tax=Polaribacter aestuariivivens TaxID=2304626 RepID=A0A5S3N7H4_9FLAO|nr:hypothetical protein [Polaribacter aestuariivivens]TMM31097.1 hypothetical protein FDT66_03775 [Polaribacter aestuariivivens]
MNTIFKPFVYLFVIAFSFSSCESTEEEIVDSEVLTPWERKFYGGQHNINNISFFTTEIEGSTNVNFDCFVCQAELPSNIFTTATIKIYLPKHPQEGFQTGLETLESNRVIIRYDNGLFTEDVYEDGSLKFIGIIQDPNDDTKELSGFEFNLTIPSFYNITKDNFEYIEFPFFLKYLDNNGNEIFRGERTFSILNSTC